MDKPICFSRNFINKQNVRSFNNIIHYKYLTEEAVFLENLFQDKSLTSEMPEALINLVDELRKNLRSNCKEDFKQYFDFVKYSKKMVKIEKEDVLLGCTKALQDIVPKAVFGGNHNYKIFRTLVFTIIYSMNRQHIFYEVILKKWDFSMSPWHLLPLQISYKILYKFLHWIMKYILSPIICLNFYVTTCKLDSDENKLYFFRKQHWQSFYDKIITDMVFTRIIRRHELNSGKLTNNNLQYRLMINNLKRDIPKLHLVLKSKMNYRPIVCYKNGQLSKVDKSKIKEKLTFLKMLTGKKRKEKMEKKYAILYTTWLENNKPMLYFIKTDLSDAFGSINREQLLKILNEKYLNFQASENCFLLKRKFTQYFKEIITELQKPLLVRIGSTIYEWKRGLVQGYKYSPALSELYYSHMDDIYFKNHMKHTNLVKLFIRVVDDYLYITDSIEDAQSFLAALSNYKNVNYEKTLVNFPHQFIKYSKYITFLGHCYDTLTLGVNKANNVYSGQICYKISFSSAIENLCKFLESRIGSSSIQISGHVFNLHHNNETSVWENIFVTLSLAANKFCTILAIVCDQAQIVDYFSLYKKKVTVKLCNVIIETIMKNKPNDQAFVYCINHLRFLSYKALFLCSKMTPKCHELVPLVKTELSKCNCLFGKWKEHASVIYSDGQICQKAVKEICRRPDLKIIMKKFDHLPDGFQCYRMQKLCNESK
ncbi:telomerase reverse transcriptase-like [Battus philenor]|uniref:telomerase reverse transcriptase-like n=1 Tax=Battus philenor TaxID=42288 RepID=UPI0035CF51EA